jgi:hypothetical protein
MLSPRIVEIIRHFRENGLKVLLQRPANVRDLLTLIGTPHVGRIDFKRMTVDPTSYVASDYRHLASDLVLKAPYRAGKRRGTITLYILIEHQSEPDALMILRVLDYVVQLYKSQVREWERGHKSLTGFLLQPVLPVVLYTGTRPWDRLGRVRDLVAAGEAFADVTPDYGPLFLSLPAEQTDRLESAGGYLGWVLELIQQRKARPEEFEGLLARVVAHLEGLPSSERARWLELLSYVLALVYHDRKPPEHEALREVLTNSVATDERRREVYKMGQTMADVLRDEGREKGFREGELQTRQQTLLLQLRERFGKVPKATEKVIAATQDVGRLEAWLKRFATADTLEDVGIGREI